jgi:hypothetical protein
MLRLESFELQVIQSLLKDIKKCVVKFETTNSDLARVQALENCLKLTTALEHPKDVILKLFLSVSCTASSSLSKAHTH